MSEAAGLWALFTGSFLAATLLPGGSEAIFYAVLRTHPETVWSGLIVATLGNTLGGMSSYFIGRLLPQTKPRRGLDTVRRYGSPALFFAWLPIVGDPLCLAAGWLRINAGYAALFMALGKFARYAAIAVAMAH
jgi:membrane protein YqaA with SNARE-associated domain